MSHDVVIFHNPACGTSRQTLALIRSAGIEPKVIEYMKTPPTLAELRSLGARMKDGAGELLRAKEPLAIELGLVEPSVSDEVLLDAIAAHPRLLNRPVVVSPLGVRASRPPDLALGSLP